MTTIQGRTPDAAEVKQVAAGRWLEILTAMGGISLDILDGHHHPCPKCRGTDRFRTIDAETGALFCNQCFHHDNGDGIAALMWLTGQSFPEVVNSVADYLGVAPTSGNGHALTWDSVIGGSNSATNAKAIHPTADAAIASLAYLGAPTGRWDYHNPKGELVGIVLRVDTFDGKKIRPVSRNGSGWVVGAMPAPRPLYGLRELADTPPSTTIYICEGEKAADAARSLGLVAMTSAGGAQAAGQSDWGPLRDRQVVAWPDHDDPGHRYVDDVARLCTAVGAASIKVLDPAALWQAIGQSPQAGDDAADWIRAFGDAATDDDMRRPVLAAAKAAPEWMPAPVDKQHTAATPTVEPFRPFPVDALPGPLNSFVDAAARAMVCDSSFVALPLLAALASAIGSTRRIVLKRGWSEPAILWVAIVGESGTTKTPAFKLVMKPLWERQSKALRWHTEEMKVYKTALMYHERDLTRWRKDRGDTDPPEEPECPQAVRYVVSDTTVEALAPLLLANPRGLLLARDELAGWFGSFDRYASGKGGDSAHWLSMHGGESLVVDRKTGLMRTIFVPQAYVSVCGGIQPCILNRALGVEHRESGLAARLLLTYPPRRPKRWTEADIDPQVEAGLAGLLVRVYDLAPAVDTELHAVPVYIGMTPAAKRVWVDFYNVHGAEQIDLTGELSAAWSKLEGYAARLALIVHYARWAANDPTLEQPDRVDADSMRRAVTVVEWCKVEARRVYAMLGETDEERECRQLADWIGKRGGKVTARELQQGPRRYRGSIDVAEEALQELVKAGYGAWHALPTTDKGGRPGRVFRLGNSGNGYTTDPNPGENGGSVAVAGVAGPETQNDEWGEV